MNADIRCFGLSASVTAKSTTTLASPPFVTKFLVPLITHPSAVSVAMQRAAPASLPLPGSVSEKQPIHSPVESFGRYFCFCASVPKFKMGSTHSEWCADTRMPVAPQARDNSSTAIAYETQSRPVPPYSAGTYIPNSPIRPSCSMSPSSNRPSSSRLAALGAISLSQKSRSASRSCR